MGRCFGRRRRLFAIAFAAELAFSMGMTPVVGSDTDAVSSVEQLAAMLGSVRGCEIPFNEQKHTPLLVAPLISSGVLYYDRGLGLARQIETPRPSLVVIDDHAVRFEGPNGWQSLDVASHPALAGVVDGLFDVFKGDTSRLERTYTVNFEPEVAGGRGWRLALEPRDPAARELVGSIALEGRGRTLLRLMVSEHGGMESVSTFHDVNMARRFSDEEKAKLFHVVLRR
jgi:hypothetical protein